MATKISYVDETINPIIGCSKCSPGCLNCYAEKMANRLAAMESRSYRNVTNRYLGVVECDYWNDYTKGQMGRTYKGWNGKTVFVESALEKPLHWKKPRRILVCSMGDLFHESVPIKWQVDIMAMIEKCKQHEFLLLSKRPEKMAEFFREAQMNPPVNATLGVTVCNQQEADEKIPILLQIPAAKRWLSIEPYLSKIDLWGAKYPAPSGGLQGAITSWPGGLDWVVIGCESGPNRRPCELSWMIDVVEQCKAAGTLCYVKQVSINGKVSHRMDEWPEALKVQEIPKA